MNTHARPRPDRCAKTSWRTPLHGIRRAAARRAGTGFGDALHDRLAAGAPGGCDEVLPRSPAAHIRYGAGRLERPDRRGSKDADGRRGNETAHPGIVRAPRFVDGEAVERGARLEPEAPPVGRQTT